MRASKSRKEVEQEKQERKGRGKGKREKRKKLRLKTMWPSCWIRILQRTLGVEIIGIGKKSWNSTYAWPWNCLVTSQRMLCMGLSQRFHSSYCYIVSWYIRRDIPFSAHCFIMTWWRGHLDIIYTTLETYQICPWSIYREPWSIYREREMIISLYK